MISRSRVVVSLASFVAAVVMGCGAAPKSNVAVDTTKIPITTSSEAARDAFLKGRWLFDNLRVTDAHAYFLKAVEADPNFALAHLRAANTAPTNQEFFEELRRAADTSSDASEGERLLIAAFEAAVAGEPETQRAKLDALVAIFPDDERAHNALGNFLFFNQQEYEQAITSYRAAIALNPDFAQPYNQMGYALRFIGDYDAAEEAFQHYMQLIPDQPNPYDSYAELLMKMGRYEDSIANYEKALEIDPNFVNSYVGIASDQMFMDRFDDARSTLEKMATVARNDAEHRATMTWTAASYLYQDNFEAAIDEIQRREDIAANTDDRGAMAGDLNAMGNILLRAGLADEAASKYRAQIEMMDSSDATDEVKEAVRRNQKYDLARVALWKDDVAAASELADAYREEVALHNVRFEVQRTHELDGMIAFARGDLEGALTHFEEANQQDPQIWLLKARTLAAMGDSEGARAACQHVIEFNQLNFNLAYVRGPAAQLLESL